MIEKYKDKLILGKNFSGMLSDNKISKGGLIGALLALLASVFSHKTTDSKTRKIVKSGAFGAVGYFVGSFAEKKINEHKSR